ncbi:MAG TPA: TetR/AcrR family transcriptional regulator [Vicinamibacterales bacterium]|nr:TetR/AcrR family transcriptional regulator [Vicinamibacterales bacterium]
MTNAVPDSSRSRLLAAGKALFARNGFEQTSTSAVARDAGTSESQLVRYFTGKAGLLDAIFEEAWKPMNARIHDMLADASSGRIAVSGVLTTVLGAFDHDDQLATLFLFEGRRIRGDSEVRLSAGFVEFNDVVQRLVRRGQKDGSFDSSFDATALAAALIGSVEAMIRERLLAKRDGNTSPFSDKQLHKIFEAMLEGFKPR